MITAKLLDNILNVATVVNAVSDIAAIRKAVEDMIKAARDVISPDDTATAEALDTQLTALKAEVDAHHARTEAALRG